jgi:hypothetical protein
MATKGEGDHVEWGWHIRSATTRHATRLVFWERSQAAPSAVYIIPVNLARAHDAALNQAGIATRGTT